MTNPRRALGTGRGADRDIGPRIREVRHPGSGCRVVRRGSNRPVVVKPRASAGTDQLRVCRTAAEVADAGRAVLDSRNVFGKPNGTVPLQEFLRGEEFYVNTVSLRGVHKVAEMCGIPAVCVRRQPGARLLGRIGDHTRCSGNDVLRTAEELEMVTRRGMPKGFPTTLPGGKMFEACVDAVNRE